MAGQGHPEYMKLLEERLELHLEKSGGYGTNADPMANFTLVAQATGEPRYVYPVLRSLEKITRIISLHGQGRVSELEEEFKDIASLMDCAAAMLREDSGNGRIPDLVDRVREYTPGCNFDAERAGWE